MIITIITINIALIGEQGCRVQEKPYRLTDSEAQPAAPSHEDPKGSM